jgi:hypothetical protein
LTHAGIVNPKLLKELLHASPFRPFSLVLVNGTVHHVGNPDVFNVTLQGNVIYQDTEGPTHFINPVLISEVLKPTGTNDA